MKGILNFKGIERTLISFRLPHRRRIDTSGYPCSLPRDSFFYVSFLAEEGDDFFMQWMCGKNIAHGGAKGFWHDGEIVFYDETSDGQEFYRYDLQYVMPIHFRLEYDHQNGMVIHLTLTALDRVYNHLLHTENFYGYFFEYAKPKEKPKPMPKEEPDILEIYYTDEKGNRIDKEDLQPDTVVYLVIKGQNLAGKTGDLELSNAKVDFEHQGVYLENDILDNYTLESDYNKIELKVIKPKND
ncbi:type VI secretion system tube protein TssD [Capnocytophaga canis]|uniref:type VI secretion system tube protein TssD n=1 Tax=Capnocytophaga canis TaxID=1848903 RepID=UPI001561F6E0|nr:type VI secretion system tube protein TssD [Capnocytophaga canis]